MKQEIVIDGDCIRWGDLYEQRFYILHLTWRTVSKTLGFHRGFKYKYSFGYTGKGTKMQNKQLTELLGCTPKVFAKVLRACQYKLWVKGKEDLVSKLCFNSNGLHPGKIMLLNAHYSIIQRYLQDKQFNLIPFAHAYGLTTRDMKKTVGKGVWKFLCSNSFTRNKLLTIFPINALEHVHKLSSSVLKHMPIRNYPCNFDALYFADSTLRKQKCLYDKEKFIRLTHLFSDTYRLCNRFGITFNPLWSEKRMEQEHNKLLKLDLKTKIKNIDLKYNLRKNIVMKYKDFTATPVTSPLELHELGIQQHHCVFSYNDRIVAGRYMVYKVEKDSNVISTIGITVNQDRFILHQHYGFANKPVTDDEAVLAQMLIEQLNR